VLLWAVLPQDVFLFLLIFFASLEATECASRFDNTTSRFDNTTTGLVAMGGVGGCVQKFICVSLSRDRLRHKESADNEKNLERRSRDTGFEPKQEFKRKYENQQRFLQFISSFFLYTIFRLGEISCISGNRHYKIKSYRAMFTFRFAIFCDRVLNSVKQTTATKRTTCMCCKNHIEAKI